MSERPTADLDLSGIHVLVVDDDADSRDILATVLRYTGAQVSSADSAHAALDAVHRVLPDVIVCDLAMPGQSGYDFVGAIRRDPGLRHIPVIAATGYSRLLSRNRALAVGFKAYLEKPIDLLKLCRTIRAVRLPQSATR
jgi:CheY-like chemotaxis protein